MLGGAELVAFIPSRDLERSRQFYVDVLGLGFSSQDSFALALDAHGTTVRVTDISSVEGYTAAPFTILGWRVENIEETVRSLTERGVMFQRYHGMRQDEHAIWNSPSGARVAWFHDPDGNTLSIGENL
ncbi:MAG TPA: VOC family protein [Gemmatimonadaceae bacterium]|jgi:catechol 2,3-dioxygenase-like lactoylglutathione lyase family enzyme